MMIITKIGEILVEVCGDSTAAIAFASRRGLGTPKRMMTRYFWEGSPRFGRPWMDQRKPTKTLHVMDKITTTCDIDYAE